MGYLMPQVHNPPQEWMWLVDQGRDQVPDGVWFCATLCNGDLPTISPYGDMRVRIPIDNVIEQLGGIQNVSLYLGETKSISSLNGTNTYVRLMLVKQGDNSKILKFMQKVNIADNPWLILDTSMTNGLYKVARRPIWVEIYIPYCINVSDCHWDQL